MNRFKLRHLMATKTKDLSLMLKPNKFQPFKLTNFYPLAKWGIGYWNDRTNIS